jgi:hypothetical protein
LRSGHTSARTGLITRSYASNMADAAYYVGACQRECNTVLALDRGTNSMLGYSGTNAGGHLVVRDSVFDHNRTGLAPNSLNNDDAPPPQDGRCPGSATRSCLIIEHNLIAANNNPNVPATPLKTAIGTGVQLIGGAFDTIRTNLVADQGAWGWSPTTTPTWRSRRRAHTARAASSFRRASACSPRTAT